MWTILKVFSEFVTILLLFHVLDFGCQVRGILAPRPGIEPTHQQWKAESQPLDPQGCPARLCVSFLFSIISLLSSFCLCWVFGAADSSLAVESRAPLCWPWAGSWLQRLLLWPSAGSRECGLQVLLLWGSRAQALQSWCRALVTPRHVGSSQTRDRTSVFCTVRWVLSHGASREASQPPTLCF